MSWASIVLGSFSVVCKPTLSFVYPFQSALWYSSLEVHCIQANLQDTWMQTKVQASSDGDQIGSKGAACWPFCPQENMALF